MIQYDWHRTWQKMRAGFDMIATLAKKDWRVRVFFVVASTVLILVVLSVLKSKSTAPAMVVSLSFFMLALTYFDSRNRPTIVSLVLIMLSLAILPYLRQGIYWARAIGTDSLSEIQSFEWTEAVFFIDTFVGLSTSIDIEKLIRLFFAWSIGAGLAFYLFIRYRPIYSYSIRRIVPVLIITLIFYAAYQIHHVFIKNTEVKNTITQNLRADDVVVTQTDRKPRHVVVYIGESTSALHMSLYGYPRATTPQLNHLASEEGFILFHHTLSPHTHTTASLLETFTLDIASTHQTIQPFWASKKRLSIVDALNRGDVETIWISTQERSGSWNLGSSVIGAGASQQRWAIEKRTKILGNLAFSVERPDDLTFFIQEMDKLDTKDNTAIFLHSYVGHGGMRDVKTKDTWQDLISNIPIHARYGSPKRRGTQKKHEHYDRIIEYIDNSIATIISKHVSSKKEPVIFMYFSDHGESIFAGLGHDSSRFVFDMATVPFFIYFNAAARQQFSDKYRILKDLAKQRQPMTLDSVPDILAFLFDMKIESDGFSMGANLAPITLPPAINVRETTSGPTAIFLRGKAFSDNHHPIKRVNDSATDLYVAKHVILDNKHKDSEVCTHGANTLGSALVGLFASNCIEIDIVVQDDGAIDVYHPPDKNIGLRLEDIWEAVSRHDGALWLDSKNIDQSEACEHLRAFLEARGQDEHKPRTILVEFPSSTDFTDSSVRACAQRIKPLVTYVSYYLPAQIGGACRNALKNGASATKVLVCRLLKKKIDKVLDADFLSDISFSYDLLPAVESLGYSHKRVRFHTWHVSAASLDTIPYEKFRFIIAH